MGAVLLDGSQVHTVGFLPPIGSPAPDFTLTGINLEDFDLKSLINHFIILNIFPSIDTKVCSCSVNSFNFFAKQLIQTKIVCVSADLPFAQKQFCMSENIENVIVGSTFRHPEFGNTYGVLMTDGYLKGLLSRAVVLIGKDGKVLYTEQVADLAKEPNYDAVIEVILKES